MTRDETTIFISNSHCEDMTDYILKKNLRLPKIIHFLNSYNLALAYKQSHYFNHLAAPSINLIDGKALQILCQIYFIRRLHHVRGADFMRGVLKKSPSSIHVFVCPNLDAAQSLRVSNELKYKINKSEFIVPPYTENLEDLMQSINAQISEHNPDFIWIGLGTPKQDILATTLSKRYPNSFIVCVGAAIDFLAGTKSEAPKICQRLGFEWLFRFIQEPSRLFRRYFIDSRHSMSLLLKDKIRVS